MMKLFFPTFILAVAASFPAFPLKAKREPLDRPNVIVIFLDDAGYGDFSHTGNPTIHTPNITKLAREGATFPQFYVPSSVCSASRYSLLTGRLPGRSGFGQAVLGPAADRYLHPGEVTLAEGLKSRGYATAIFGKWHLGTPNENNGQAVDSLPLAHGFDRWVGTDVSHDYDDSRLIRSSDEGTSPVNGYELIAEKLPGLPEVCETLTSLYTEEAIQFIRENREEPFFIYFAPNMPHLGLYASQRFQGVSRRGPLGDVMAEIDDSVRRITGELEEWDISRNTLIVFSSDNGPWIRFRETADHPKYGEARLHVGYAMPFRDGKGSAWEGGHRVPGIFSWPGTIAPATVEHAPASTLDLLPTVFHLAGVAQPAADRVIDGRNIASYLNPERFGGEVGEFVMPFSGLDNSVLALRQGPWKIHVRLISTLGTNYGFEASRERPLLFQVEQDIDERIDRAAEEPEAVETLLGSLSAYEQSLKEDVIFWED